MEELSLILEDVDNSIWADNIRHIKIRELQELIEKKGNAIKNTNFETEDYMSPRRIHLLSDISRLQRKLSYLTNEQ
jgi:hypothetical protein